MINKNIIKLIDDYHNNIEQYYYFEFHRDLHFPDPAVYLIYMNQLSMYIAGLNSLIKRVGSKPKWLKTKICTLEAYLKKDTSYISAHDYLTSLRRHRDKCLRWMSLYIKEFRYIRLGLVNINNIGEGYLTEDSFKLEESSISLAELNITLKEDEAYKLPCCVNFRAVFNDDSCDNYDNAVNLIRSLYTHLRKGEDNYSLLLIPPPPEDRRKSTYLYKYPGLHKLRCPILYHWGNLEMIRICSWGNSNIAEKRIYKDNTIYTNTDMTIGDYIDSITTPDNLKDVDSLNIRITPTIYK
jgi:hypothetical protein